MQRHETSVWVIFITGVTQRLVPATRARLERAAASGLPSLQILQIRAGRFYFLPGNRKFTKKILLHSNYFWIQVRVTKSFRMKKKKMGDKGDIQKTVRRQVSLPCNRSVASIFPQNVREQLSFPLCLKKITSSPASWQCLNHEAMHYSGVGMLSLPPVDTVPLCLKN